MKERELRIIAKKEDSSVPDRHLENFMHHLREKLAGNAERAGITVTIEELQTEEVEGFSNDHE